MTREEQLARLKDRPCDVCKMRTDKGCSSWKCVFEQTPNEEQEPCEDCITLRLEKGTLKYSDKDYVVYKKEWLKKWWQPELALLGIELPSIQPTAKENLVVEDCISRKQAMKACYQMAVRTGIEEMPYKYAETELAHLPSVQPKPKTGRWIATEEDWWKCSECGQVIYSETEQDRREYHAYCGRCGAKMLPTDSEKE